MLKVIPFKKILFCLTGLLMLPISGHAADSKTTEAKKVDAELMTALNSEASHESNRRGQFKTDRDSKKVFDNEREKGLALFLEEQEKWDLIREKGLADHRKQKKIESPAEGGPEDMADRKMKKAQDEALEQARILTLQTRERIRLKNEKANDGLSEKEELGLAQNRPRYELRKRGKNKWMKDNKTASAGTTGSGGFSAPPPAFEDFPPQPDYVPAPQPMDGGFEEIPPPPPMNYDGMSNASPYGGNIDSGFGDVPPPPPPPPMDYDF